MKNLFILIAVSILLSSCWRRDCSPRHIISIQYSGFDSSDLSVVVVTRYTPGGKFTKPLYVDTINLNLTHRIMGDELNYGVTYDPDTSKGIAAEITLLPKYDWLIHLVKVGRTDKIWDIKDHKDTRPGGLDGKASNQCYSGYEYIHNNNKVTVPKDAPGVDILVKK